MGSRWVWVLVALAWSTAAVADDFQDCASSYGGTALRIKACTALIEQGNLNAHNVTQVYLKRAYAHDEAGDQVSAIADYTKAIELGRDDRIDIIYGSRARAHFKKGDYAAAIADHTRAIELSPNPLLVYGDRADVYLKLGDYDRAIADLTKNIEAADPHSLADAHKRRAEAYMDKGNFGAAIADYAKAIESEAARAPIVPPNSVGADLYNRRAWAHVKAGTLAEGLADAERSLELWPNQPHVLDTRGHLLEALGRRADAAADFRRALAKDPSLQTSREALQRLGAKVERVDELNALHERVIELDHAVTKNAEAIAAGKDYAQAIEKQYGAGSAEYAFALAMLADLSYSGGAYAGAETYVRQSLAIREALPALDPLELADGLNNLAIFLDAQSKFVEAEASVRKALAIRESKLGADHPRIGESVNNVAVLLCRQGHYAEAEAWQRRALAIMETNPLAADDSKGLPFPGEQMLFAFNTLAATLEKQGREVEAAAAYRRGLDVHPANEGRSKLGTPTPSREASKLGKGSYFMGCGQNWPGVLVSARRQSHSRPRDRDDVSSALSSPTDFDLVSLRPLVEARVRATYRLAAGDLQFQNEGFLAAQSMVLDGAALAVSQLASRFASGSGTLAGLVREQQDLFARRSDIYGRLRKNFGFGTLSRIEDSEKSLRQAMADVDRSIDAIESRIKAEYPDYGALTLPEPVGITEAQAQLGEEEALVFIVDLGNYLEETFIWVITRNDVRWVRSDLGTTALTKLVTTLRCGLDASNWVDAAQWPEETDDTRRRKEAQVHRREQCRQLTGVDISSDETPPFDLAKAHELYMALFAKVEDLIQGKHLLIVPSGPLKQLPFQVLVSDLVGGEREREVGMLGAELSDMYKSVLIVRPVPGGPAEAAGIKAKDLLLSVAGTKVESVQQAINAIRARTPRTTVELRLQRDGKEIDVPVTLGATTIREPIPQVLDPAAPGQVSWLIRRHAITVLPSVASLKALRRDAKPSQATNLFIGFGNPLLEGDPTRLATREQRRALERLVASSRAKQACPKAPVAKEPVRVAGLALPEAVASLFRGGLGDVAVLRRQSPLPETADELCTIAREVGASESGVFLGARNTETAIKDLNAKGTLATSRVVQFATHGLVAGETERVAESLAEPALMLTPPATPTKTDDGLLTASEVAELKLDADWVVLSACNTAGGGEKDDSEPLSGLARAFFYAGARALLVSHWYVDSHAAVRLTTGAFSELKRDPAIGRAEALRRAMLAAMTDASRPKSWTPAAHPAVWAPFAVVGEGGAIKASGVASDQPKPKRRRQKPPGEWDWLKDLFGQ